MSWYQNVGDLNTVNLTLTSDHDNLMLSLSIL